MADLVGIDAAAKTIADAIISLEGHLNSHIQGFLTSVGEIANTAIVTISNEIKSNVNNFFDRLKPIMPKVSIDIQTKEIE